MEEWAEDTHVINLPLSLYTFSFWGRNKIKDPTKGDEKVLKIVARQVQKREK